MKTFTIHEDPGHGWLEVTLADLADVGLTEFSFSTFSYRNSDRLYLEEDGDLGVFWDAYKAKYGREPDYITETVNNSHVIRTYYPCRRSA